MTDQPFVFQRSRLARGKVGIYKREGSVFLMWSSADEWHCYEVPVCVRKAATSQLFGQSLVPTHCGEVISSPEPKGSGSQPRKRLELSHVLSSQFRWVMIIPTSLSTGPTGRLLMGTQPPGVHWGCPRVWMTSLTLENNSFFPLMVHPLSGARHPTDSLLSKSSLQ